MRILILKQRKKEFKKNNNKEIKISYFSSKGCVTSGIGDHDFPQLLARYISK